MNIRDKLAVTKYIVGDDEQQGSIIEITRNVRKEITIFVNIRTYINHVL